MQINLDKSKNSEVIIFNSSFNNNTAYIAGGVFEIINFIGNMNFSITDSLFNDNQSPLGSIYYGEITSSGNSQFLL